MCIAFAQSECLLLIPPYDADISEKESKESRFWVVSLRMKTGRVAPREEEEIGNLEVALREKISTRNKRKKRRKTHPVELNLDDPAVLYPIRLATDWNAPR
jgi:hypothetical protein